MTSPWRSRFDRADKHLEEVEREVESFLATQPYRAVAQVQPHPLLPQSHLNFIVRGYVDREPPPAFAEAVGDVVGALRSSLDRLAYSLAGAGGQASSQTEFPVFTQAEAYARSSPRKLGGIERAARAVIESLQPYHRADPAQHPLALIHELRRIDFHRHGHVTGAVGQVPRVSIGDLRGVNLRGSDPNIEVGAFKDGALLYLMQAVVTRPDPIMEVHFYPTFDVAFDPEGPAAGAPVLETLRRLRDHVEHVVFAQLEPFLVDV